MINTYVFVSPKYISSKFVYALVYSSVSVWYTDRNSGDFQTARHRLLVNKQSVFAENSFRIYVAWSYSLICTTKLNSWTFRDNLAALLADEVNNTSSPSPALRSNQEKRREAKQYKDRTTWFSQPSFALLHSFPFLVIQNKELFIFIT